MKKKPRKPAKKPSTRRRGYAAACNARDANVTTFCRQRQGDTYALYLANASPYPNEVEFDFAVTIGGKIEHAKGQSLLSPVGYNGDIRPVVQFNKGDTVELVTLVSHVRRAAKKARR